jgi:hypothetical protein
MKIPFLKSKEEREMELRVKTRQVIRSLKGQIHEFEKLRRRFVEKVRRADELGDAEQKRRYARACAGVEMRRNRTERQLLQLEGLQTIKDLVKVDGEFAELAIEMGRAMQGYLDPETIAKMELELQKGIARGEEVGSMMASVMDTVGDGIMSFGQDIGEGDADAIAAKILAEADEADTADAEEQIGEELAEIRREIERRLDDDR